MKKIPLYIYSKMPAEKVTNEIDEFAAKNNLELVPLERASFEERYLITSRKSKEAKDAAVIYARFSSTNQNEISITGQLKDCFEYCNRANLTVSAVYADLAQSGTNSRRVAFQQLHNDILDEKYNGYRYVVYSTNRFARNRRICSQYKGLYEQLGIRVVYSSMVIDDTPEGRFMEGTMEVMDEYFSNNLAKIVTRGLKERASQCRYTGGYVPYGFKINPETKLYEINEKEAENIRLLFKMYNEKKGYTEILRVLTENGARTRNGNPFTKNALSDMISNPKYKGTYVYSRRSSKQSDTGKRNNHEYKSEKDMVIVPGGVPAIVDEVTFETAQKRKEDNKQGISSRREKETYLLTGLVFCKECGHAFTGNRRFSGRNKTKYVTYRCTNHNKGEKCDCKEVNRDYLENFVLDLICERVLAPEMSKKLLEEFKDYQKEHDTEYKNRINSLIKEKGAISAQIENLYGYLDKGIASDGILHRISDKEQEKNRIELSISEMENHKPKEIDEGEFKKLIKTTKRLIKAKKLDELKRFISFYVSRIEIGKDDITVVLSFTQIVLLCGGDEENRTPVRKPRPKAFSECSCCINIPLAQRPTTGFVL